MLDAIVKRRYNPQDFKATSECCICMSEFQEDEDVTPLPCNIAHYFHAQCVTEWLKTNNTCPLCRKVVTGDDFNALNDRLGAEENQSQE